MKVSLNTLKQLLDFELPAVDELKKRIDEQLGKVEDVIDLGAKYKGAVIVKVITAVKHPNADKLTVCMVDDGGVVNDVPRDENGYVQVVCGAPNAREGIFAIWLPPQVTVPASYDEAEPFVLSAREIRGVMSQGMLTAADELDIGSDHTGIIELTEQDLPTSLGERHLTPGQDFAELFGLDDVVLDIENKMFTHRPDCFGQLGVAREVAGILGKQFIDPDWYFNLSDDLKITGDGLDLIVFNQAGSKVPRFMAVGMSGIEVKPSPFWLQAQLIRMGGKSINNVVDITNYVMLMTAQPLHAYDYDKLAGSTLGVRMAKDSEQLPLLNGKTYQLTSDDIVIVDGEKPIGLGGVMGGGNSEVSASTTSIVLECATFDMYAIRKTSMRHGLFTDAVSRFNKGQSMLMNPYVVQYALGLFKQLAGAQIATEINDDLLMNDNEWRADVAVKPMLAPASITAQFVNDRLGTELTAGEMMELLTNVGFECAADGEETFSYWSPAWRMDIQDKEDLVEEVGRLYGFDKLPKVLPERNLRPVAKNQKREVAHLIRESLARAGANEALTYSFVHKNVMERAGQDVSQAFQLSNALSPDLQYYRLSVTPSLLDKIHGNVKAGHSEFALFEIGKGHNKKYHADDDDGLPSEMEFVDLAYTSKDKKDGAPYYQVRSLITQLAADLGFTLKFSPITEEMDFPLTAPFDLTRSAMVSSRQGEFIGLVGEFEQSVLQSFKLPAYTAGMTLDLQGLVKAHASAGVNYAPLSRYPTVVQDLSLKVSAVTTYEDVFWTVWSALQNATDDSYSFRISPLTIYQGDDAASKTITLRVQATNHNNTLTDKDVTPLLDKAVQAASEGFAAEQA